MKTLMVAVARRSSRDSHMPTAPRPATQQRLHRRRRIAGAHQRRADQRECCSRGGRRPRPAPASRCRSPPPRAPRAAAAGASSAKRPRSHLQRAQVAAVHPEQHAAAALRRRRGASTAGAQRSRSARSKTSTSTNMPSPSAQREHRLELAGLEHRRDEQHAGGARGARLEDLVGADQEVLAHDRERRGSARATSVDVREIARELLGLGEHGNGDGAAARVAARLLRRAQARRPPAGRPTASGASPRRSGETRRR